MVDHITGGQAGAYRDASEELHRSPVTRPQEARFLMLWQCGLAELIRADFYRLFDFVEGVRGRLLDAGCGTGSTLLTCFALRLA